MRTRAEIARAMAVCRLYCIAGYEFAELAATAVAVLEWVDGADGGFTRLIAGLSRAAEADATVQ